MKESNLPHAAHMAWNAIVLLAYTLRPKLPSLNDLSPLQRNKRMNFHKAQRKSN